MAISTDQNRIVYQGDGSSASFNYPYEFHADSEVSAFIWNSSRATVVQEQILNTHYTISGIKDAQNRYLNGANFVINSTPATGDEIVLFGSAAVKSDYSLSYRGTVDNQTLVKALDRLTILAQRLNDQVTRSLRLDDAYPLTFDGKLPEKITPGAPIIVNSSGQGLDFGIVVNSSAFSGILPVKNGGTGLDRSTPVYEGLMWNPGNGDPFDTIDPGNNNYVLTSNAGSSAPTFQILSAIMFNSGILGVSFGGTGTGTSYPQYGVVFASSATQLAATPAGGNDQPLVGNEGAAPSYQPLNLASNSSITNVLGQANGGTGTGSSAPQYAMIFQESSDYFGFVPSAADGRVLTSHGSGAPSFDTLSISIINSGILDVTFGGTGTGTSYPQYGVLFASSATQLAATPAGGNDQPLVGNEGAAPSYQPLNLASNSSITNVLGQANGGTGTGSSAPQYAMIFQESSDYFGFVPSAADGRVLTSHGSSAPTFDNVSVTPTAPTSVNSNTTLTTDDKVVLAASSLYTITIYDANGNAGRELTIKRTAETLGNAITISGSASQISTTINTINEAIRLISDGSNWNILSRDIPSKWRSFTPTGSWTTNTTYNGKYRRVGDSAELLYNLILNGAPDAANLTLDLPSGITVNEALTLDLDNEIIAGSVHILNNGIVRHNGNVFYNDSDNKFKPRVDNVTPTYSTPNDISNTVPFSFGSSDGIEMKIFIPILEWDF